MKEIWLQLPDENDQQFKAFQLFCSGYSYSKICTATGIKSKETIHRLKERKDWEARRAAYQASLDGETQIGGKNMQDTISVDLEKNEGSNDSPPAVEENLAQDSMTAITPAPLVASPATLEQRVVKIKFYLNQTAQNIIEIGKELTAAKNEVGHGNWDNWLKANFDLSQESARKFMNIAKRFGNSTPAWNLSYSQMVELLALPAGKEEDFIEAQAAAGQPVEGQSKRELHENIKDWKTEFEAEKARADKAENERKAAQETIDTFSKRRQDLIEQHAAEIKEVEIKAAKEVENKYNDKIAELQNQLETAEKDKTIAFEETGTYTDLRNRNAELEKSLAEKRNELETLENNNVEYKTALREGQAILDIFYKAAEINGTLEEILQQMLDAGAFPAHFEARVEDFVAFAHRLQQFVKDNKGAIASAKK